jgi:hypothetical protein
MNYILTYSIPLYAIGFAQIIKFLMMILAWIIQYIKHFFGL